jgi:hypothetical protein
MGVFGYPFIELSPSGLKFNRPATLTIDPRVAGLEPNQVEIIGVDPENATTRVFESAVVDGKVRLTINQLAGESIFLSVLREWLNEGRCTPYAHQEDADAALADVRYRLLPLLLAGSAPDAFLVYNQYLSPGTPTQSRALLASEQSRREFREDPTTQQTLRAVWADLKMSLWNARYSLGPPERPTVRKLETIPDINGRPLGQGLNIEWGTGWGLLDKFTAPVLLAGGMSTFDLWPTGVTIPDERHISGLVRLVPHATERGVRDKVDIQANLELRVLDGVDFCQGGAGNPAESVLFTHIMSRLENTPHPNGRYVTPQLFEAVVPLDTTRLDSDITAAYQSNDRDGDSVPDAQPWEGASFELDNCPDQPNPDQADADDDGKGDLCEGLSPTSNGALIIGRLITARGQPTLAPVFTRPTIGK